MKNYIWHIGVVAMFALLAAVFFAPAVFDGKVLPQGDSQKTEGMSKEAADYTKLEGRGMAWTGSMFSGMPAYTVGTPSGPDNYLTTISRNVLMFEGNTHAGIVFLSMLLTYVFLFTLGCNRWISVFGAVAYGLSSYYIIIIGAGHITKCWAMAYVPLVLAGMVLIFKQKYIWGALIFSISLALELRANHMQITYYLVIICFLLALAFSVNCIREKQYKHLLISAGLCLFCGGLGALCNGAQLESNLELSKTSIRGKSKLSPEVDNKNKDIKSDGLDLDYAFSWSYGKMETLSLLIPNVMGGESGGEVDHKDSHLAHALSSNGAEVTNPLRTYTYWGDQPFTSGPVYLGAIVCFLFVFSLFVVDSRYKWWLAAATFVGIVLSWGKNADINTFLFNYLPLYNKFRTPSMALVIPQITCVILSCLALKKVADGTLDDAKLKKSLHISAGIVGGICLIFWIMPGVFLDFSCANDAQMQLPAWYLQALVADRQDLCSSDAFRSLVYVLLAYGLLFFFGTKSRHNYFNYAIASIALLSIIDLWSVDRRFINDKTFVRQSEYTPFTPTVADNSILADKDPSYRVLTFDNPFNDTNISYYHKSIGGYNAAKLRDYQDLIDLQIDPEMQTIRDGFNSLSKLRYFGPAGGEGAFFQSHIDSIFKDVPVLNMLNTRYFIINSTAPAVRNSQAYGNAWFVRNAQQVNSSDEEMVTLGKIDPRQTALINTQTGKQAAALKMNTDAAASIQLTSYKPDELTYKTNSKTGGLALFSEVYYPHGWTAQIDGKDAEIFCSNWILRSLEIPAGAHTVKFTFYPTTYWTLRWVGSILSLVLLLSLVGYAGFCLYRNRKQGSKAVTK